MEPDRTVPFGALRHPLAQLLLVNVTCRALQVYSPGGQSRKQSCGWPKEGRIPAGKRIRLSATVFSWKRSSTIKESPIFGHQPFKTTERIPLEMEGLREKAIHFRFGFLCSGIPKSALFNQHPGSLGHSLPHHPHINHPLLMISFWLAAILATSQYSEAVPLIFCWNLC